MIILAIRTDSPVTELILLDNDMELARDTWESGRSLASTILTHVVELCKSRSIVVQDIEGIICYEGPGSFTGLRIGITVGNTLAYSNTIPIVGSTGDNWLLGGLSKLLKGKNKKILTPKYGSEANITM